MRALLSTVLLAVFCAGCASDKVAQAVAQNTVKDVAEYQGAVDAKIAAEKAFYRNQLANLRTIMSGSNAVTMESAKDTNPNPPPKPLEATTAASPTPTPVPKSLIYGRITTDANIEARILAEQISASNEPQAIELLTKYIADGLAGGDAEIAEIIKHQRELDQTLGENLAKLDLQSEKLSDLREKLTALATSPTAAEHLKEILILSQAVSEEIDKQNKQNSKSRK